MKLIELDPRWFIVDEGRHGQGVTFDCPVHRIHKLAVGFANPVDGLAPMQAKFLWRRQGETFDDLTLGPSVDASGNKATDDPRGEHLILTPCWHGFIRAGEVTNA